MFTVTIQTDNAAFDDGGVTTETARILRRIANLIDDGQTSGTARDTNGNKVGTWELDHTTLRNK